MTDVYLSIGSNLGQKEDNISRAVALIDEQAGRVVRTSDFYYSEPWGFSSENSFVNQCVLLKTELQPIYLLHLLQRIEKQLGRTEKSVGQHYSDRVIDIDILLYGNMKINTEELVIPHPLMYEREFVMIPLKEILTKE